MRKPKKLKAEIERHYDCTEESTTFVGYQLTIVEGSSYCVFGKRHRHQFVGFDFDSGKVTGEIRCTACGKQVTLV